MAKDALPFPPAIPGYPIAVPYPTPNSIVGIDATGNGSALSGVQVSGIIGQRVPIQSFPLQTVTADVISTVWAINAYRRLVLDIYQGASAGGGGVSQFQMTGLTGTYNATINSNSTTTPFSENDAFWKVGWNGSANCSGGFVFDILPAPNLKMYRGQSQIGGATISVPICGGNNNDTTHDVTSLIIKILGTSCQLAYDLYGVT